MFRVPIGIVAAWMLSFCLILIVIGFAIDAPHLFFLQYRHGETVGKVTRLLPDTHGLVEVSYIVGGMQYQSKVAPHIQTHPIAEGDAVRVYYSLSDPTRVFIASPAEILAEQLPSWIGGALLMSLGVLAAVLTLRGGSSPLHRFSIKVISPKLISTGTAIGVIGGLLLSFYAGTLNKPKLFGGFFVLCGCAIFLTLAWMQGLSWTRLLRSAAFWIAIGLAILGNVLNDIL